MQDFFQVCADYHIHYERSNTTLQQIFEDYGIGQPTNTVLEESYVEALSHHVDKDSFKICRKYLGNGWCNNFILPDVNVEAIILNEVKEMTTFKIRHWLIECAEQIGVANALIRAGHSGNLRCAENEFVCMFVGIAKHYGESVFLKTLCYTGILTRYQFYLYAEILNQVAELFFKVPTRCVKGMVSCSCYRNNLTMYEEYQRTHRFSDTDPELLQLFSFERYHPLIVVGFETFSTEDDRRFFKRVKTAKNVV